MRTLLLFPAAFLLFAQEAALVPVAGPSPRGDGGPASEALLDGPLGLAADASGNVYISESNAGVIRRVRAEDGVIERFAGTGALADGQEGHAAIETSLLAPTALAIATDGSLLFGDSGSCRVRKVLTDGMVRNVAGTGRCASAGGGGFVPPFGGGGNRDRLALDTELGTIGGIAIDPEGRIVFSEENGHRVRRLDHDGFVRTIAGIGQSGFGGDNGSATSAVLNFPAGVAFDPAGNLYIADGRNCRIRRVDTEGTITTIGGSTTCVSRPTNVSNGAIGRLWGLAYSADANALFIASPGQSRLLRIEFPGGRPNSFAGNGTLGVPDFTRGPSQFAMNEPYGVAAAPGQGVVVSAFTSFQVVRIHEGVVSLLAGKWPEPGELIRPGGTCTQPDGALLTVDTGADRIIAFRGSEASLFAGAPYPTGFTGGDGGPAARALIGNTRRILCAPDGNVYLTQGSQIRRINPDGVITLVRDGLDDPFALLLDPEGRLIISEASSHRVTRYETGARSSTVIAGNAKQGFSGDGGSATDAQLNSPGDLAFDSAGDLLIADRGNRRVRRLRFSDGKISTVAGSSREFSYIDITGERASDAGFDRITGMTADSRGYLYIAESNRLCSVSPAGVVTIMLGFAGESDSGVQAHKVRSITGLDALSLGPDGLLNLSVRQDGAVLSMRP